MKLDLMNCWKKAKLHRDGLVELEYVVRTQQNYTSISANMGPRPNSQVQGQTQWTSTITKGLLPTPPTTWESVNDRSSMAYFEQEIKPEFVNETSHISSRVCTKIEGVFKC